MNKTFLVFSLLFFAVKLSAQTGGLRGVVLDAADGSPLTGATASILYEADTTLRRTMATGIDGEFLLDSLRTGRYLLRLSFLSYSTLTRLITVDTSVVSVDTIRLEPAENTIGTVTVQGQAVQSRTLGDTLEFDARAFKTNPDGTAEDLIGKMPGVTNDGTGLKVNGESVQRVLVDGKPFFGDDASAALKNLPAEVVSKVQISDRKSDQARFTGFDDGNAEKTINIVTRDGKNQGFFGKVQAGYGGGTVPDDAAAPGTGETKFDPRYTTSATVNYFKGPRRITVLGMSNNVNQQNFSIDDIVGAMSSNNSAGGGMGAMAGGRGRGGDGFGGRGNSSAGGSGGNFGNIGNLFTGQQNGISTTSSLGLNYTDQWGTKIGVTGSYFFNRSQTTANTALQRQYITGVRDSTGSLLYNEENRNQSTNMNHRANLRIEYTIDSSNELIIIPRVSFQDNTTSRDLAGVTTLLESVTTNRIQNQYNNTSLGLNLNNELTYRHRFAKRGRTVSIGITTGYNTRSGEGSLYSVSESLARDSVTDQIYDNDSKGFNLSSNISYTEPAGRRGQVLLTYQPSHNRNEADRYAYDRAPGNGYSDLNTTLSNVFDNQYTAHRGGAGYRFVDSVLELGVTVNAQYARLSGEQTFPDALTVDKPFFNLLPQLQLNYKFSRLENLRLNYRSSTNTPSITQLQSVVDNSNPLLLRTGNVDLRQDYTHNLFGRYNRTNIVSGISIFGFGSASYIQDYIGNSTITALNDTTVGDIFLARGTQLSRPVNLDGAANARFFLTYSRPFKSIKSNASINSGLNYNRTPALINGLENRASNYGLNGGLTLSSNVSENLDFTASIQSTYTVVRNSLQTAADNNYYNQISTLRLNYIFLKGVVFNTTVSHNMYTGLGEGFNQNFVLWNASLGYKFLKSRALQADIFVFDILKQNNAISRTVNDSYIEDSRTDVLQRYGMLRLTYTIRRFQGKRVDEPKNQQAPPFLRMMQGGGMPPGMMGGPTPGG